MARLITIDGPAGAGKSTVSFSVAKRLGYRLLNTGSIYRAVAWLARQRGVPWDDGKALAQVATTMVVDFDPDTDDGVPHLLVDGVDREAQIRTEAISSGASQVSKHQPVRRALLQVQRRLAGHGGLVAEGRDMGTVVFPHADLKVFLTASDTVRAERRRRQLEADGAPVGIHRVLENMRERDRRDTERVAAPLKAPPDALHLDSSEMTLEQVISRIIEAVGRAGNG